MTIKSGFVNINKPTGMTSTEVVNKVKKILKIKKVGHLGTLDPAASGVLPIAFGKATKFFEYFLNKDKCYKAIAEFGVLTDTLDSFGNITENQNVSITENDINAVLKAFRGKILQTPPKFSAIKIDGKRAYELARDGQDIEIKPREIEIYDIKLEKELAKNRFLFSVHCSAGTYIRTLFNDIAQKLGTVATTTAIIRTKSGPFSIEDSLTIDEFDANLQVLSIDSALCGLKKIEIDDEITYKRLLNGVKIDKKALNFDVSGQFFVTHNGNLVGLYHIEQNLMVCDVFLCE